MEVASAIVGPVVNVLTVHIKQKLGYLTSYAEHVEHMRNRMQFLEDRSADIERLKRQHPNMPAHVPQWSEDVKMIKEDVDNIPSNSIRCFSVKKKFLAGRNALRLTKVIERLIKDGSEMVSDDTLWREAEGYLGRVDSINPASTSTLGVSVFNSRVKAFNDALKLLQEDDDHTARVIALCGMGGVGKTTLMKQLKEAAHVNKMFNWIAVVTVGKSPNVFAIQDAIAEHTGKPLTKSDEKLRADYLSKRFKELLERKEKILVILDDVWEKIKLEDIGLASPFPHGVKLLLTSRDVKVCQQIATDVDVDVDSAFKVVEVSVLEKGEGQDFFFQIAGNSARCDHDLYDIGCEIVKKCGCLPLAIKLIAGTLICEKNKGVWRSRLKCLKNNDLNKKVQEIIEMSYNKLKEEDKNIFLLCGLFPEDSNIPIEDLTRYAWGFKLLNKVSTMEDARDRIETSVSNLKNAYLLMDGDSHHNDCVKLHDLVLAFVVNTVSKDGEDGCWIIHHEDDFSNWSEANSMSQSCKQISLSCKGMSEFPSDLRFPNLSLLKLMHGDESLRFPQAFYATMENLQVIAFERMKYPLVPTSSTKLRTLCLDKCSLKFDLTCIGNLSNLEVLSFANSGITNIPSTFGNLKKLRLLDVTGCCNLVIDDGVLKSLVKLEELYMIPYDKKACCFTDNNNGELAERSKNLCALEFEFIGNNAHMKNVSCEKLKRFKLSVGCSFTEVRNALLTRQVETHSYENSLKLITNREELELLKSIINELFRITDALYLRVNDMNTLPYSLFSNLRLLVVTKCTELTYLFTLSVATNLSKLEYLDISGCPNMEAVIHTENEGLLFSNLKYLRLAELPKLLHFCNKVDVIELSRLMELQLEGLPKFTSIYPDSATSFVSSNISPTQSFLNKEDEIPKLEKLFVKDCDSIKVLFNMDFGEIEQPSSGLRSIKVDGCNSLVKLFSCNPFPFFNNLQELDVRRCRSIKVLFEIDSGRAGRYEEQDATPKLEKLFVSDMENLTEIWSPQFSSSKLPKPKILKIKGCNRLEHIFTFSTIESLMQLEELEVNDCKAMEVIVMEENGQQTTASDGVVFPHLKSIKLIKLSKFVGLLGKNKLIWPALEKVVISECPQIVLNAALRDE